MPAGLARTRARSRNRKTSIARDGTRGCASTTAALAAIALAAATGLLACRGRGRHPPLPAAPEVSPQATRLAALEREAGAAAVLEPRAGLWEVTAMAWSPDGSRLAVAAGPGAAGADGDQTAAAAVHVLSTSDYQSMLRLGGGHEAFAAVTFSPEARTLAASTLGGEMVFWDLSSARPLGTIPGAGADADAAGGGFGTLIFSPDGKLLAGRRWDAATVPLWDVATRAPARTLRMTWQGQPLIGPRGGSDPTAFRPALLAFSADGTRLYATGDHELFQWNLTAPDTGVARVLRAQGAERSSLADQSFCSLAVQPQGRVAAAGTESGQIVSWNLLTGTTIRSLAAHKGCPQLGFSRDGDRLTSVSADGALRSFEAASLAPLTSHTETTDGEPAWAEATALDADGARVATAGGGGVSIRDVGSGRVQPVVRPPLAISAIAIDSGNRHLAIGTWGGTLALLTGGGDSLRWLRGHTADVTSLAFSADGRRLVSGSRDHTARVWDLAAATGSRALPHAGAVDAVAFGPGQSDAATGQSGGPTVVTGGDDGSVRLWDADAGTPLATLEGSPCAILTVRFTADGSQIVANASDHTILHWDARTHARLQARLRREYACASEIALDPGTLAVTAGGKLAAPNARSDAIEIWSADSGQIERTLTSTSTAATSSAAPRLRTIAASPRQPIVAAAAGGHIRRWRLDPGTELPALPVAEEVDIVAFSADGRFLIGAGRRGALSVWQMDPAAGAETKPPVLKLTLRLTGEGGGYAQSPDGRIEWLGAVPGDARCRIGARFFPAEVCQTGATDRDHRFTVTDLLAAVLAPPATP